MNIRDTDLDEVKIIEYEKSYDNRGCSFPVFTKRDLEQAGIFFDYVEEKLYCPTKAGTLYGIHFQNNPKAQSKLLYCMQGRGLDYAIDLRKGSSTYLRWTCIELSAENRRQIYIPKGFGHVFLSMEDATQVVMRIDEYFDPAYSRQIAWNDPSIGIPYPIHTPILAPHDVHAPRFKNSDINL